MKTEQQKDEQLWQIAKARASFKWSFTGYFVINTFLVVIWFLSSGPASYFWPIWSLLGMGVGVAFQYYYAYHGNKLISIEKEFEKLKKEQETKG